MDIFVRAEDGGGRVAVPFHDTIPAGRGSRKFYLFLGILHLSTAEIVAGFGDPVNGVLEFPHVIIYEDRRPQAAGGERGWIRYRMIYRNPTSIRVR